VTIAVTHEMISRNIQGEYLGLEPDEALARTHRHHQILRLHDGSIDAFVGETEGDA
jgi:hypothetical protein